MKISCSIGMFSYAFYGNFKEIMLYSNNKTMSFEDFKGC